LRIILNVKPLLNKQNPTNKLSLICRYRIKSIENKRIRLLENPLVSIFCRKKAGHSWFKYLDVTKVNTGTGVRSLSDNGILIAKYQLVVQKGLSDLNIS
jgi:hypothetical protein